jgi:hypothetical protein
VRRCGPRVRIPLARPTSQADDLRVECRRDVRDRALLTQTIANVVENAICHAMERAMITIDLEPGAETQGPQLIVADNGPGIPPGERENLFRRFYRLDASRGTFGNGLGLARRRHRRPPRHRCPICGQPASWAESLLCFPAIQTQAELWEGRVGMSRGMRRNVAGAAVLMVLGAAAVFGFQRTGLLGRTSARAGASSTSEAAIPVVAGQLAEPMFRSTLPASALCKPSTACWKPG